MTTEIGTLRALPNGESVFVGSSSGVFFINTVRRAFSHAAAAASSQVPSPEECIVGPESHTEHENSNETEGGASAASKVGHGELPNHDVAKELFVTYFRTWHPLFPFLHGPTCLEELENLYQDENDGQSMKPGSLSTQIIIQCLFNIAKLDRPDLPQLGRLQIRSDDDMILSLSKLSLKSDLASIQALLAAQLYFVATMSLHAASSTGGLILRSIFKSGLHRCPVRYVTFDKDERDMRKRVFWSAYTLDRFTSQSLGHPLGLQDSDIDVCSPGEIELHRPVFPLPNRTTEAGTSPEETILHLPANHPSRTEDPVLEHNEQSIETQADRNNDTDSVSQRRSLNQSVQSQFVHYSKLLGRMVEMFHKSISSRTVSQQKILYLKADIDGWGNSLPYSRSADSHSTSAEAESGGLDQNVFFAVCQQQLLLLVNRPSLSLEPTSAEFRHAVQLCIGAARSIIRILESHFNSGGTLFWPGFMSAVWMSGLVLVFACQLKLHSISNAISDISASLRILNTMTARWSMAQNCHDVLSMLLENIQSSTPQVCNGMRVESSVSERPHFQNESLARGTKRAREDRPSDIDFEQEHQRLRLSMHEQQVHQTQQPSSALGAGNHSQLPIIGFDASGQVDSNGQPAPGVAMDPYLFPGQQPADYMNGIPGDAGTLNPNEWNTPTYFTPGFDPTTHYDIFDGAMWGSLLELVEPCGN
ncbi:hypothetical protein P280DRAFT_473955 [Massarina eburnea CBS 473.64]|uniref:Xylanolytic transcriptional activator regulatory domain-containing protein n=1 Tax=Massarina eburnea CBS 473.64 TaxID=1395130 RepID=A0A6A6RJE7_9PLEO|nr:hypothetical protein P280DRAFT_473955 [Massarina eburnea CBS 473.64]